VLFRSGLIYFQSPKKESFSGNFPNTLQTLAAIIGSRLKSMGTIDQLKQSMAALEYSEKLRTALYEINEEAYQSHNINKLYEKLHQIVAGLTYAKNFYIALVEERDPEPVISFPYFVDTYDARFQGMEIEYGNPPQTVTAFLLKSGQPLLITPENCNDLLVEHNIRFFGNKPHSWLGVPFSQGKLKGAVVVQSYRQVIYTEKDKALMSFVARHIGGALKRKQDLEELFKAKDRAEQAEKKKSNFLANMSHEIRTPMNGIIGLTELILKEQLDRKSRTYLEMIHVSADRLLKLINDILDFSKIEAGKLELNIANFSLRNTIADVFEMLSISSKKRNLRLTMHCDELIPDQLLGDADKLTQILTNLVSNGMKFTTQGGVDLSVRQINQPGIARNAVFLSFRVHDTGIGIPPDELKNVFQAFSQLGTTRSTNNSGTGLGLVIAAELVELMGGKICVDSEPGIGTSFYFTIPFTLAANSGDQPQIPVIPPHGSVRQSSNRSLHILIAEDEYINRTLATAVLQGEGWEVTCAETGQEVLNLLKDGSFDLILMDVQMPVLDGFSTTSIIRVEEKQSGQHLPIIAMTAYAIKGDREKCLEIGMDGYIAKPINTRLLREEIENVLMQTCPATNQ
jgi:signal transduction histidine kinase/CheY-like chemotaxis protein